MVREANAPAKRHHEEADAASASGWANATTPGRPRKDTLSVAPMMGTTATTSTT